MSSWYQDPLRTDFRYVNDVGALRYACSSLQDQIKVMQKAQDTRSKMDSPISNLTSQLSSLIADCGINGMNGRIERLERENAELKNTVERLQQEKRGLQAQLVSMREWERQVKDYKTVCDANEKLRTEMEKMKTVYESLKKELDMVKKDLSDIEPIAKIRKSFQEKNQTRNSQAKQQSYGGTYWARQ